MSESYVLYQYASCPFCARVERFLREFEIDIARRDTLQDREAQGELVAGGGSSTVPCLRISSESGVRWLYESLDIMQYLYDALVAPGGASHERA